MVQKKKETKAEIKPIAIPIEYNTPEGTMTPFATNMLVQIIENEFKISFFELKPFLRLSESDPIPSKMRADYIGGVIVSADRLPNFIKALQGQLEKYQTIKKEETKVKA